MLVATVSMDREWRRIISASSIALGAEEVTCVYLGILVLLGKRVQNWFGLWLESSDRAQVNDGVDLTQTRPYESARRCFV